MGASSAVTRKAQMTVTDLGPSLPVPVEMLRPRPEPVHIEIVRECHFKAKPPEKRQGRTVQPRGCAHCDRDKHDRAHAGQPPSLNPLGSGHPMLYQSLKARWQGWLGELLAATDLPKGLSYVLVEGEVTFPSRARRDQGNFRFMLEKALGDALVEGGWLEDDDWSHYEFGGLEARYEKGRSATRLMLFPTLNN